MILVGRRLMETLLLVLGASLLCFVLIDITPGDFLSELRANPQLSSESIEAMRSRFGLDRSLPERYFLWIRAFVTGSWGISFQYGCTVSSLVLDRAGNTLLLTLTAMLITWPLAILAGVAIASARSHVLVRAATDLVVPTLLSIPDLILALALMMFAVRTGMFPSGGMTSLGFHELTTLAKLRDLAAHLTLPACCLAITALPVVTLHVRSAVVDALGSVFLRAARAHGIGRMRLLFRHTLLAASNSLISLFGLSVGSLISTSLVVEAVMGWPGLGRLMVEAIQARDVHVVVGATVASAFVAAGGSLLSDLMLMVSDSRIRASGR